MSYRQIETLEDYVLVAQDKMEVTGFARENGWQPVILRRPDEMLRLASLDLRISLRAIYDRVAAPL